MSNHTRLQLLFAKYLQRNCTPQEVEEMIQLLQEADAADILNNQLQALWQQQKDQPALPGPDWDKIYAGIINTKETTPLLPLQRRQTNWKRYAAAAVLIPLIGISAYWLFKTNTNAKPITGPVANNVAVAKKQHNAGRQTIHLPDGSTVILNESSRLNYPSAFNGKTRDVYLTGEGFFDIQHNPRQPFMVHTGKIAVKVLGTAFNIKTQAGNQNVEVTVTRGKVQVLNEDKSIGIITASQQLQYTAATGEVQQTVVDTLPVLAWKPAEILYNDISMEEMANRLEERFGLQVQFSNPTVKKCHVTATFSEDDLPEEILAVVCAVTKSDYTINNKTITINGKGCN
ncbi:MAG: FecR domain-containing protein [Chitinophagaceae bacterium]